MEKVAVEEVDNEGRMSFKYMDRTIYKWKVKKRMVPTILFHSTYIHSTHSAFNPYFLLIYIAIS